ncbi:MAG: hypothetical protein U0800_13180 [Isosphaeraceae bacterium]
MYYIRDASETEARRTVESQHPASFVSNSRLERHAGAIPQGAYSICPQEVATRDDRVGPAASRRRTRGSAWALYYLAACTRHEALAYLETHDPGSKIEPHYSRSSAG